jgi:CPA2 family monovalent cation:H+ antiporter-2
MGTAWLTSLAGLSLALGAFVAGLVISESEYSNQIVAEVLPFRDTFSSLFFISIGMLLDMGYFFSNVPFIVLMAVAIMTLKALVILAVGKILKYPLRLSIMVALSISQIGEFSFILIEMGRGYAMLGEEHYQALLAVSILTMAITPFLFMKSSDIAFRIAQMVGSRAVRGGDEPRSTMTNHVIIVGYGLNGRNLAKVLKSTAIDHLIMEVNSDRVKQARKDGHEAMFADASHPHMLEMVGTKEAKMFVVGITDPVGTRRAVKGARELNPALSIIVRTRYINEVEELYALGASEVIPEEFETSVEIFARVLRDYRVPGNIIQNQIDLIRGEGYAMLRSPSLSAEKMASLTSILETSVIDTFYVQEGCYVGGRTIEEIDLRGKAGATVMAILRKGKAKTKPPADYRIEAGDTVVIIGSHAELNRAMAILKEKCPGE